MNDVIHRTFPMTDIATNVTVYATIAQYDDMLTLTLYGVNPEGMEQKHEAHMRIGELLLSVDGNKVEVQLANEHQLIENAKEPLQTVVPVVSNLKDVARRTLKRVQLARQAAYQHALEEKI